MHIEVIEVVCVCSTHGEHRVLVPAAFPRPSRCAHCFQPLESRIELRRFNVNHLPNMLGSEVFMG